MAERIAAFLLWAAVAACAVFWGLRVLVTPAPVPSQAAPVSVAGAARGDVVRLFAAAAEAAPAGAVVSDPGLASRFKLIGVMAPPKGRERGAEQGIALIAVDGKPPRPYRVGARLDRGLVLQSVAARSAAIGPVEGAPAVQLDLPPPQPAAIGSLPPPPANDDPGLLQRQPRAGEAGPAGAATGQIAPMQVAPGQVAPIESAPAMPAPAPAASPTGPSRLVPGAEASPPGTAQQPGGAARVPDNRR